MELTAEVKEQIDGMSYTSMLRRWRFSPSEDTIFQGESGDYFSKVMREKKEKVNHVAASKEIGW